jgi:nucleoside 2-deoxyribosyltransferase
MRVYLAAGFSRKNEIAEKSQELENLGIKIVSTWTNDSEELDDKIYDCQSSEDFCTLSELARKDENEIKRCDALVLFTQSPKIPFYRGGRMDEAGFARALGKTILVCGPRENLFHYLPEINQFNTWEELKATLTKAILV